MADSQKYQVLARKYRPQDFSDLIGQEAMVRTLKNAFAQGRIAHAFIMTGVRGVGKTTTARIIAKGLNCIGPNGTATEPTTSPCGECVACRSISEGRNIDVLELDAASNTQVEKMRDIIASVPYRPSENRYKVFIFDEVHMLSNSAFNAILKTLEEPPAHVKFIFATTEIRKIPVTVLSRCQRFDLRRIEPDVMVGFLQGICTKEKAAVTPEALRLLARAAEGSVRDALSLLDQAIAIGNGETNAEQVRAMMGLADYARVLDLFEDVMSGSVVKAIEGLRGLYHDGADAGSILKELAEITHWISILKVAGEIDDDSQSPEQITRGQVLADRLELPVLARTWQMLLKLTEEIELAPNRLMGAEMAIIRLCHVADQPPPGELLAKLQVGLQGASTSALIRTNPQMAGSEAPKAELSLQVGGKALVPNPLARFTSFQHVIELFRSHREVHQVIEIEKFVRLAKYTPGRIEFSLAEGAPSSLPSNMAKKLESWTGARWGITVINDCNTATIEETVQAERAATLKHAEQSDILATFFRYFPKAEIIDITPEKSESVEDDTSVAVDWEPIDLDDLG